MHAICLVWYREPSRIALSVVIYMLMRELLISIYVQRTIEEYRSLYGDFGSLSATSAGPLATRSAMLKG
jgi:hypothetical protein